MIRPATPSDAAAICEIYNPYVLGTAITFEEQPVSTAGMADRITTVTKTLPWLVLEEDNRIIGYAYATPWRVRSAYRFSVESTIYLGAKSTAKGNGTRLYCLVGGIALPNPASVALHEKLGFTKVAQFSEIGRKFDRWIDVGFWDLKL
jgi:L-amino acid N-acyltransferase YncA